MPGAILVDMAIESWGGTPVPRWTDADATAGRQARARATRRALLLAAARLVDEHGYHGASLNDVAAVAGTTKGAVYFHFASKRAVAEALFDAAAAEWDDLLVRIEAQGHDSLRTLLVCYDAYAGAVTHDPMSRAAFRVVRDTDLIPAADTVPRWPKAVADLVVRAQADGLLVRHTDPERLSRHLFATATGHFHLASTFPQGLSLWDRMNDTWLGLLPVVAAPGWAAAWLASDWADRPAPVAADYTRLDPLVP